METVDGVGWTILIVITLFGLLSLSYEGEKYDTDRGRTAHKCQ